jgi:hypothetical protein
MVYYTQRNIQKLEFDFALNIDVGTNQIITTTKYVLYSIYASLLYTTSLFYVNKLSICYFRSKR